MKNNTNSCDPTVLSELNRRRGDRSWLALAVDLGISRAYLSDIIRGNRAPGPRVLEAIGLKRTVVYDISYRKIEIS